MKPKTSRYKSKVPIKSTDENSSDKVPSESKIDDISTHEGEKKSTMVTSYKKSVIFTKLKETRFRLKVLLEFLFLTILLLIYLVYRYYPNFVDNSINFIGDHRKFVLGLVIFLVFLLFSYTLIFLPKFQSGKLKTKAFGNEQSEFDREKERLTLEDNIRKTWAQILGGLILLATLIPAYYTFVLNQEGQITDRFNKAVTNIGSNEITVRLGGLYALERIDKDSEKDHWTIVEIISSFVRERSNLETEKAKSIPPEINSQNSLTKPTNAKLVESDQVATTIKNSSKIATDVQTALTILGRLPKVKGGMMDRIDLTGAYLPQAKFIDLDFSYAFFINATLTSADFSLTNLTQANFIEADLKNADFGAAKLNQATFRQANLAGANFRGADLSGVDFYEANLKGSSLDARKITAEQLAGAVIDQKTVFSHEMEPFRAKLLEKSKETLERLRQEMSEENFKHLFEN